MVNLDYLKNLNEAQTEAVTHLDGPLLIVAGAGSGKTKVLTSRIAHIIKEKKAYPNQILSVTLLIKLQKKCNQELVKYLGKCYWFILVRNFSFNMCKTIKKTCNSCKFKFKFYNYRY
jgi:superfamily I DNA/RNA helicase